MAEATTIDPRRFRHAVLYALVHGALMAGVWYGGFQGVDWAGNLVRFGVWVMTLIAVVVTAGSLAALAMVESGECGNASRSFVVHLAQQEGILPVQADVAVDLVLVLTMAASGWTVTAFAWLFQMLLGAFYRGVRGHAREWQKKNAGAAS